MTIIGIRPLAVGAAWLPQFDLLAPSDWGERIVRAQLFKVCDMEFCGWGADTMRLYDNGAEGLVRRWRVKREARAG